MTLQDTRRALVGDWRSLAPEVRPSAAKNPDGTLRPFYLSRAFTAFSDDRFELTIRNWADPYGKVEVARIVLRGHIGWPGPHPLIAGAQKADFTADEAYEVTPMAQGFADLLNQVATIDGGPWVVGQGRSVLGRRFLPFGLVEGQHFKEYDLIHLDGDLLFWGARHIDGRGFDSEENRPTNLQIPMRRVARS
ncbi:hypothetical protein [Mitsuaria sp. 7]|uniref:hypothetical protein n=1 Tax=Mitsuaria sp. 7 TaxID=1658665 RepID=UPI0007DE2F68|nr:hypothetical protein [Mitsuaria sp. 7]ANH67257.1 hypothetical protein ABE85_06175 [Mitsuaria sp. 7]